jgi:hypothetical protein
MLTSRAYAGVKIKPAVFRDSSHLQAVATAAGATDVPMAEPPSAGWPACTCTAVILAAETASQLAVGVPMYPFIVGDAACRRVQHYKAMRAVAQACTHWNAFVDELIRTQQPHSPIPQQLHSLAQALELTWSAIDPNIAAATGTAFGELCATAPERATAIATWRSAATYLNTGEHRHLQTGLVDSMLVRKAGLIEHAANALITTHLDAAVAALEGRARGCVAAYTTNVHHAMAWTKHADAATADSRLLFHTEALRRSKNATVPPVVAVAVSRTIAGWSA